jgi:hypothetical protein
MESQSEKRPPRVSHCAAAPNELELSAAKRSQPPEALLMRALELERWVQAQFNFEFKTQNSK